MALSHLLMRRLNCSTPPSIRLLSRIPNSLHFSSFSAAPDSTPQSPSAAKPTSLSARMNFIFDQIDEIDKDREEKDNTLQRIRAWRESKKQKDVLIAEAAPEPPAGDSELDGLKTELAKSEAFWGSGDVKKEVELVHPWPEWIELMERLLQQNYFDHKRKDEDGMMQGIGFDLSESSPKEDKRPDFARDFRTVQAALVNFGRDRFDILRSLSRQDLQLLVGYGCPSPDKKVSYSGKLLRKYVHLDEGDVCSSCSLRGSCEKAYLLTTKEDEARTIDVMRILLEYGFDPINGSIANQSLAKMKPVKTVVRKLLHEVVKLSAVPIDPNLPPPVIKRPPSKVKQPPPTPKRRVGRDDIEMKKGDWLCPKCEFMNFAKNTVCLQCDAKRPKRQLLPGEWECPQCNFLNYRRNTVCFHCEHNRPPDTYTQNQFPEKQRGPNSRMDKKSARADVSNAWNFDFDDNESDGADVATFEYADSRRLDEDFSQSVREGSRGHESGPERSRRPMGYDMDYPDSTSERSGAGFNDFDEDDDDIDSYEVVSPNDVPKISRVDLSELEVDSESEDLETDQGNRHIRGKAKSPTRGGSRQAFSGSEDDEVDYDTDDDVPVHPNWKTSHVADAKHQKRGRNTLTFGSDDDSDSDDEKLSSRNRGSRRGSNRMEYSRGGGRSNYKESISERDSGRRGFNRMDYSRGGRRSDFRESFSERDSDDEDERVRSKSRGNNRRGSNRMEYSRGGRSNFNESFSDDDGSYRGERQRDRGGSNRGRGRGGGDRRGSWGGGDFDRSSSPRSSNRGSRGEESYGGRGRRGGGGNSSKFGGRGGSYSKRGGRRDSFDDRGDGYQDERQRRPRVNVR